MTTFVYVTTNMIFCYQQKFAVNSFRFYMQIVVIWTVDCPHQDYAVQMTRFDFLNIAQTGVVAKPQTCILEIIISNLGPGTVYTNWNIFRFTPVRQGNSHDRIWLTERRIPSKLLKMYYSQIERISDTVDSERPISFLNNHNTNSEHTDIPAGYVSKNLFY
jgi:hypothetical protein